MEYDDEGNAVCPSCRETITGALWGSRGECLDCFEESLLPPARVAADGTPWDQDNPEATPTSHPVPR